VKGSIYRTEKYDAKYSAANVKRDFEAAMAGMVQNFATAAQSQATMLLQVKQVCDGAGVSTIAYPFYLSFGRELWALTRRDISGESAAIAAALLVAKWKARGLDQKVLYAIRTDLFGINAPIPPGP
jgi:hypothetical protein